MCVCVCCFSCWGQMKRAPPLNVISTPAPSNQRLRDCGSLWTSQKPLRTGCQIQVGFTTRFSKMISAKTLVLLIYINLTIYLFSSFFFLLRPLLLSLQRIISGWSWVSTVRAAPSYLPPTILFPTRARSWRLCLQVCCSSFCWRFPVIQVMVFPKKVFRWLKHVVFSKLYKGSSILAVVASSVQLHHEHHCSVFCWWSTHKHRWLIVRRSRGKKWWFFSAFRGKNISSSSAVCFTDLFLIVSKSLWCKQIN